jgi:replication factor C subunit 3/5
MAEETYPMDIDFTDKGKTVIAAGNPSFGGKASLWVEKYRPQSLDDVAAHRDIVDTSNSLSLSNFPFHF